MMNNPQLYIVDVFAENKYEGNQLAVVRGAGHFSDRQMQQIAKEMNYSETTFIVSEQPENGGYHVRIFTPEDELPFAGHPTLGTAFIIQQEMLREKAGVVNLNLEVGQIPVKFNYEGDRLAELWMTQMPPEFGPRYNAGQISHMLHLDVSDIDPRFPIQEVSTGVPAMIVPLKSLDAVRRARIRRSIYFELVEKIASKAILIFAPETVHPENQLHVRVFVDYYGVPEDPATGSANGCLAGYLAHHHYWGQPQIETRVEQGYEIGRPSLLLLRANESDSRVTVQVGGRAILVARGELV